MQEVRTEQKTQSKLESRIFSAKREIERMDWLWNIKENETVAWIDVRDGTYGMGLVMTHDEGLVVLSDGKRFCDFKGGRLLGEEGKVLEALLVKPKDLKKCLFNGNTNR